MKKRLPSLWVARSQLSRSSGGFWYSLEKVKSNNELKRKMVECGTSVEEIERVMAAGVPKEE